MKLPKARRRETPARTASRAAGRIRYPLGKALARIRYFEVQRGVDLTRHESGRVVTAPKATTTRSRSTRTTASRSRGPRTSYASAAAMKARLEPAKFAAAANLPVWRELGPTSIPHGQTYGEGLRSKPAVSGRCSGIFIDP